MFPSYEATKELLRDLIDELPEPFYKELNLGIILEDQPRLSKNSLPGAPLYILGLYSRNKLGRQITIYYGSFKKSFPHFNEEQLKVRLRETLRHEFRHHLEFLAGEKGLVIEDEKNLEMYLEKYASRKDPHA